MVGKTEISFSILLRKAGPEPAFLFVVVNEIYLLQLHLIINQKKGVFHLKIKNLLNSF